MAVPQEFNIKLLYTIRYIPEAVKIQEDKFLEGISGEGEEREPWPPSSLGHAKGSHCQRRPPAGSGDKDGGLADLGVLFCFVFMKPQVCPGE